MRDLCIDVRMAFCSGIGTYIRELVPLLQKDFRITLLVDQLSREWCEGLEQILFTAPIYSLKEQWQYPSTIPPCDLFWSPHYNVPLFKIRAKKRLVTIHDIYHLKFGSLLQRLYAKLLMRAALQSDGVITVSEFSKSEIENHFKVKRVRAVHIGVNQSHFYPREHCDRLRQKYQLPQNFALFVGSHKPHKNLDGLKKALAILSDVPLIAVGNGLLEVAHADLPVLYSMAQVFVFPSLYEGFGLPPLEAMSCGCPTAVAKKASIPEVCGEASLYFDPENIEEMAQTIQRALQQRDPLIQKGFQRASLFSWEKCAESHRQIFEEALDG